MSYNLVFVTYIIGTLKQWSSRTIVFLVVFQFDNDYLTFRSQIEDLQSQVQSFVDTWFERSLSVSEQQREHIAC